MTLVRSRRLEVLTWVFSLWLVASGHLARADFSVQPAVSTNSVGNTVELALVEDGAAPADAFDFAWFKGTDALQDGGRILGSTTPLLRIASLTLEDSGTYSVYFTNMVDTNLVASSASATVYVVAPVEVAGLVADRVGTDVTFRVNATGGLLSYQWFWQGQELAGATQSTLRFTNAYANANGGYYTVRVSNPATPDGVFAPDSLLVTKPAPAGTYQGLFFNSDETTSASSGFVQFNLSSNGKSFSGKAIIGKDRYSFSGQFPPDQYVEVTAQQKNAAPLLMRLQLLTVNDAPQITGDIQGEGWLSTLLAHRLPFSKKSPTPLAGRYTLVLQNTNTAFAVPNGDTFASVVVQSNGTVVLNGRAADDTPIKQTTGLSRLGDWPLYVAPNQARGRLIGWLKLSVQSAGSIQGNGVAWLKDPGPDRLYPEGFSLFLQPTGSTFTVPGTNAVVAFTNGVATVFGGDLYSGSDPIWVFVRTTLKPPTRLIPEKSTENFSFGINQNSGLMRGSFLNPATGKRANIQGAVLQQQKAMRGFFASTNLAGAFQLVPAN